MSANDPEKGYPEMGSGFYSKISPKPIHHTGTVASQADWRIPYKAGFLKIHLTDARSGRLIDGMRFDLVVRSRPKGGRRSGSWTSTTAFLLPPNEDVYFTVSAPGYRRWPEDGPKGRLLNLLPGATENLFIALQPESR